MENLQKYNMPKWKGILLLIQLIFVILAFIGSIYLLWFSIKYKFGVLTNIVYLVIAISYMSIIFYGAYGYKKQDSYFLGALYTFSLAILLNIILPFRSIYQMIVLILFFGGYIALAQRIKEKKIANIILIIIFLLSLMFSIYSTITSNLSSMGEVGSNIFTILTMYLSIWTPVIMTITLGLSFSLRQK